MLLKHPSMGLYWKKWYKS